MRIMHWISVGISDLRALVKMLRSRSRARAYRRGIGVVQGQMPWSDRGYEVAIYFADQPRNMYQIRQWYEPFLAFAQRHPTVIITRSSKTTLVLQEECPLDVQYCMRITDLERFVAAQERLRLVFYVNQNRSNLQMLGFHRPAHVHVNHGESDKVSMVSNALKAYDRVFIAGPAARDRILSRLFSFPAEHLVEAGRPQIDVPVPGPVLPEDNRTVVLYAPTWEGDRPGMTYSSILSHGQLLVNALLSRPDVRLIFRPHPRTGTYDRAYRHALHEIERAIAHANERDPGAAHLIDTESRFGWQTKAADLCVCDISAVAFDWLATGKPFLITEPVSGEATVQHEGIVAEVPLLSAARAGAVWQELAVAGRSENLERMRELCAYHYGDTTPGASMERFLTVSERVWSDRDAQIRVREDHA
ncbi:MAG: CDP-glycerol glycerophosphotransferase family protein [Microbacteriaceae bacterium]|jgi:hypothetical protein|nr:CDP-glycerol glycerophosphotransferase family protein [Microbacteriaceae bacterium]MCI1207121.1 CDP-glycerol glycerophosphotransferase family protein [Microbacteriaceae bacterium]